jgi:hypothetical protein
VHLIIARNASSGLLKRKGNPRQDCYHLTGTNIGVPLFLTKKTRNFAGFVLLALRIGSCGQGLGGDGCGGVTQAGWIRGGVIGRYS